MQLTDPVCVFEPSRERASENEWLEGGLGARRSYAARAFAKPGAPTYVDDVVS